MEFITLNDGNQIPAIGFGTFQIPADGSTYKAVRTALELGIRHIDTAVAYFNEQEVGQAVKDSGIPRSEIWITSKMWLQDFKYEDARKAIDLSLKKPGMDYMDLYLIHPLWHRTGSMESHGRGKGGRQDPLYRRIKYDAEDLEQICTTV